MTAAWPSDVEAGGFGLGLLSSADALWRLRLGGPLGHGQSNHPGSDDHVPNGIQAGSKVLFRPFSKPSAACTRTTSTSPTSTHSWTCPSRAKKAQQPRAVAPATACASKGVGFTYPGAAAPALEDVNLHLKPGTSPGPCRPQRQRARPRSSSCSHGSTSPVWARSSWTAPLLMTGSPKRCGRDWVSSSKTLCTIS